jgi:hydrogenase maturation protease
MITEEQIRTSLQEVLVPAIQRSVIDLNLVREIGINGDKVTIKLASTAMDEEVQRFVTDGVRAILNREKIKDVVIEFVEAKPGELNEVKNIIAIMSGKGGVGKSLVTALMAIALQRRGLNVGILDADITGSSIPRMFGVNARPTGSDSGLMPVISHSGIEIMSMNLLLPQEESAVIWRAPLLSSAITQFWNDVVWGKLDYLLIDLPPGTADAPLTVMQSLPLNGVVIVSTPQGLVEMIVKKAVNMAQKMNKPIIGVVENMSYFYVPETKRRYEIFGESKGEALAEFAGAPLLGKLPIDPQFAYLSDRGEIEQYSGEFINSLGETIIKAVASRVQNEKTSTGG